MNQRSTMDPPGDRHLRTALFVDFDNIYLRLQHEDPRAAEQFATHPSRWLAWLREGLPFDDLLPGAVRRRKILFRRCYLNPSQFGRFRPDFSRAAFEVVDCPPLTSGGKTSADIHMVMDILDTLNHATHFDEFIILSGDADFTPVLLRLSKHDRRSAVLAIGPASAAYKAACDHLIDEDTFLEEAIGVDTSPAARAAAATNGSGVTELLTAIADKVYEQASASGELVATDLPAIYRGFPEFTASNNWLGFNSLRAMTFGVVHARPDLAMVDGDPWKVRVRPGATPAAAPPSAAAADATAPPPEHQPHPDVDLADLTRQIVEHVRGIVDASDSAVPMARAAQMVIGRFGDVVLATRWAGAGTFRDLLAGHTGHETPGFALSPQRPGYLFNPDQHQVPTAGHPDEMEIGDPELAALAYRIHQLTDTPYLTPAEYALLFRLVAEEVNQHGYFLHRTSKAVRDRCIEEGSPIARGSVNFILRGIAFSGHRLGMAPSEEPVAIAERFAANVQALAESAGLALSPADREHLDGWLAGELRRAVAPSVV